MMKTSPKHSTSQDLANIRTLVNEELKAIDQLIFQELQSGIPLIQTINQHIIKSGGKRLRPLLVILAAKALNYTQNTEHHELAVVIEFIHTATLLHDDVVDNSTLRRGEETANALWGNQASVLVGDFLYSRSFQILSRRSNVPVMKVLADATNTLSEGEVMQLMNVNNPSLTEENYLHVIKRKTAVLFQAATQIGAMIGPHCKETQLTAMSRFGLNLGIAYQIIDDCLDYTADTQTMGKNVGDDLAGGKITLPLIYTLQEANPSDAKKISEIIQQGNIEKLDTILQAIHNSGSIQNCFNKANYFADVALEALNEIPKSKYRNALSNLVRFVVNRHY